MYYFVIPFTIDAEAWELLMNCHLSEVDTEISSKNQENSFGMQGPKNKLNAMMHRSGRCLQMGTCFWGVLKKKKIIYIRYQKARHYFQVNKSSIKWWNKPVNIRKLFFNFKGGNLAWLTSRLWLKWAFYHKIAGALGHWSKREEKGATE